MEWPEWDVYVEVDRAGRALGSTSILVKAPGPVSALGKVLTELLDEASQTHTKSVESLMADADEVMFHIKKI